MSAAGLYREVYSLELRKVMTYRTEFWFKFLGVLFANMAVAYFLWSAVYEVRGVDSLAGFTLRGMVLYYMLVPLIEGISRSLNPGFLSWEIYEGGLTRFLVYPVAYFPYQYVVTLARATMAVIQMALVLAVYALVTDFPPEFTITPATVLLGIGTAVAASLLNFALVAVIEMVAFWADNVWSLSVMLMFTIRLLGGGMIPLALFPETFRDALAWLPFQYLVYFPIQAFTGQLAAADWTRGMAVMMSWTVAVALLASVVWKRGNLKYTGVGI